MEILEVEEINFEAIEDESIMHPLQTCKWGSIKQVQAWQYVVLQVLEKRIVAQSLVLLKKIPKTNDFMAFIPFGPLFSTANDLELQKKTIKCIGDYLLKHYKVKLLKIHEYGNQVELYKTVGKKSFKMLYDETYLIDLSESEETLFQNLHKKHRNEIKKGLKNGTRVCKSNTKIDLENFYKLHKKTFDRTNYETSSLDFFEKVYEEYIKRDKGNLYLAYAEDKIIAGAIIINSEAVSLYMWGASSGEKEYNAYEGQKVLLWEAILDAKREGKQVFDLGGVTSTAEKGSKREGIYIFKRKFGGKYEKFSGTYNIYLSPFKGRVYDMLLKWYLGHR